MAYELYIHLPDEAAPAVISQSVVEAFASAGLPGTEQPDKYGHWLVLEGVESALDLTIKDGLVVGAGFRFCTEDDASVIEKVTGVFKSLGFLVSDDEGDL